MLRMRSQAKALLSTSLRAYVICLGTYNRGVWLSGDDGCGSDDGTRFMEAERSFVAFPRVAVLGIATNERNQAAPQYIPQVSIRFCLEGFGDG